MNDFKHMDSVVDEICHSLENEPETWKFESCTMSKNGVKYWTAMSCYITDTWMSGTRETVFSKEQGRRIRLSYEKAREITASEQQKKIIQSMKEKEPEIKAGDQWEKVVIEDHKPWWHKLLGL